MEQPQETEFKWFGEGFEGFPKRLPEDSVEYRVYIINAQISDTQAREQLGRVERAATDLTKKHLAEYIWQRDSFNLKLEREENRWILQGYTNFGDSVADEWVVVYLLRELSKTFNDIWIRVYDTDGEFLLIESANTLPRWLTPEVAENRVWIHEGRLLLVPVHQPLAPLAKTEPISRPLTVNEALLFISSRSTQLTHSPLIEEEAFYRIRNHPKQITENVHHACLPIPRKLAYILHRNGRYVSAAIEAFYLRDPISLRPLNTNDVKKLKFPPNDIVKTSVRFPKVGYAQLYSQDFVAPKSWEDTLREMREPKESKSADIGMKLTSGFEMLMADPSCKGKSVVREIDLLLEDVEAGEESLPSNEEIHGWSARDDDDGWLDIDFNDLDNKLKGKSRRAQTKGNAGFGDQATQDDLQRMVERFEEFLNDDESDDMDEDNDDDGEDMSDDEDEDREVSFDEEEFMRMMREMMGVPSAGKATQQNKAELGKALAHLAEIEPTAEASNDSFDSRGDRELLALMEAELKAKGALNTSGGESANTDSRSSNGAQVKGKGRIVELGDEDGTDQDSDDDVDIDFDLAQNLLQSLKEQSGTGGPVANLANMMDLNGGKTAKSKDR